MLSAVFFEKAIWAFFGLVASLIAVIYKLFNGSLQKDLKIQKENIKDELEARFEIKFDKKIGTLEVEVGKLRAEIQSFKTHENNNSTNQKQLLNQILRKLDKDHPRLFGEAINEI